MDITSSHGLNSVPQSSVITDTPPIPPIDEDTAHEFKQRIEYAAAQAAYHEECARRFRRTEQALAVGIDALSSSEKSPF